MNAVTASALISGIMKMSACPAGIGGTKPLRDYFSRMNGRIAQSGPMIILDTPDNRAIL